MFSGIFYVGKIKANNGYKDDQETETNTHMFLDGVYMAYGGFLRHPTKLPADENPQVNNQGLYEEDDHASSPYWVIQISRHIFLFFRLSALFHILYLLLILLTIMQCSWIGERALQNPLGTGFESQVPQNFI